MPRVAPATVTGAVAERIRCRRGGQLTPLDEVLLHSEAFADGWNSLLGAVRTRMELPGELRELAICRIAALNDAHYEWQAHEPIALQLGMTPQQMAALREGADTSALSDTQRLVLAYTDAVTRHVAVSDQLADRVHALLGTRQFVELTATIAAYNMVSRFLVALGIEQRDEPHKRQTERDTTS